MNFERWKDISDVSIPPNCMDWRHVQMVNAVLVNEQPKSIVEIGCFQGFSTAAIIEADEVHPFEWVDLIDPHILTHLKVQCPPHFKLHQMFSGTYSGKPECWIIDGDHEDGAYVDYGNAIKANARIIVIHDSNAGGKHPRLNYNYGAAAIADKLRKDSVIWFEDKKERPKEQTHRGLLIGFFYVPLPETNRAFGALTL